MSHLNYIHVFFDNSNHSYITDLSSNSTIESVISYFFNTTFDVGTYPVENIQRCTGLHFYNRNNDKDYFHGVISADNIEKFGLQAVYKKEVMNSFKFNSVGELIEQPETFTFFDLQRVYTKLIRDKETISASRIQHLNNINFPNIKHSLFFKGLQVKHKQTGSLYVFDRIVNPLNKSQFFYQDVNEPFNGKPFNIDDIKKRFYITEGLSEHDYYVSVHPIVKQFTSNKEV